MRQFTTKLPATKGFKCFTHAEYMAHANKIAWLKKRDKQKADTRARQIYRDLMNAPIKRKDAE